MQEHATRRKESRFQLLVDPCFSLLKGIRIAPTYAKSRRLKALFAQPKGNAARCEGCGLAILNNAERHDNHNNGTSWHYLCYDVWNLWNVKSKAFTSISVQFAYGRWTTEDGKEATDVMIRSSTSTSVREIHAVHRPILRFWESTTNLIKELATTFDHGQPAAIVSCSKDLIFSLSTLFRITDEVTSPSEYQVLTTTPRA